MTNTQANIGHRKNFGALGDRNFENSGTVQYKCARGKLDFLNATYYFGDTLPFDVADTSYSLGALAQLQLFWDQEWIAPVA